VSGPLTERDNEFRAEIMQIVARTALAALAAFFAVAVAGYLFVGRPVRRLVAKARRIGSGDLTGPLAITQKDEVGELAKEINQMCERLAAAQARVEEETNRRLATSEQLRHADRLTTVGKLASGVAHELGTPLNVVSGRAKMIVRGQVSGPGLVESAQVIVDQTERMTNTIRQLLNFARRRKPQHRRESLRGVVERTLSLLRPMAEKSSVVCKVIQDEPEPFAEIDGSRHAQGRNSRDSLVRGTGVAAGGGTERPRLLCLPARGRHRNRDDQRTTTPRLRAFLHDQGRGQRHGPRAVGCLRHRARPRGLDSRLQRAR
jgi:two-component system NtrC family sensor kinase